VGRLLSLPHSFFGFRGDSNYLAVGAWTLAIADSPQQQLLIAITTIANTSQGRIGTVRAVERSSLLRTGFRRRLLGSPRAGTDFDEATDKILGNLNERGYKRASFERLNANLDLKMKDQDFEQLIQSHPTFRKAFLKGGRPGLAKRVP
jgi:hypothetical protein